MHAAGSSAPLTHTGRLEALSDGTFAIIITLLALEIHRPDAPAGQLLAGLRHEWPSYLAYAVAFVNVGVIWLNHHYVFGHLAHADLRLNWINLGVLGTATLIPFPTGVLAGAFGRDNLDDQRVAVVLYALIALLMSAAWIPLFVHLRRHSDTLAGSAPPDCFATEVLRPVVGCGAYVLAALLGWFVTPLAAVAVFMLVVAYYAATSTGVRAYLTQHSHT